MVDRGQFLERMTVVEGGGEASLEALFHRGARSPALVVVPGVPGFGGNMESAIATELTWAASQRGHSTLRFNFRGVGASTGALPFDPLAVDDAPADALDALRVDLDLVVARQFANAGEAPVHVVAIGLGAHVALLLGDDRRVEGLTLVVPHLVIGAGPAVDAAVAARTRVVVGQLGADAMLARVHAALGADVEVDAIPDADHRFLRNLSLLGARTVAALDRSRPSWLE